MKSSLKETKEKKNKKLEEINKSLKETQETQEKNNYTDKANSSRLEDWNRGIKENINWGNSGYGKSG